MVLEGLKHASYSTLIQICMLTALRLGGSAPILYTLNVTADTCFASIIISVTVKSRAAFVILMSTTSTAACSIICMKKYEIVKKFKIFCQCPVHYKDYIAHVINHESCNAHNRGCSHCVKLVWS